MRATTGGQLVTETCSLQKSGTRTCSCGCKSAELGRQGTSSVAALLDSQASVQGVRRRSTRKDGTAGRWPALLFMFKVCGCSFIASARPWMLRSVCRPSAGTATAPQPQAEQAAANEAPGPSGALCGFELRRLKAGNVRLALSAAVASSQKVAADRGPGSGPHWGGPDCHDTTRTMLQRLG